MAFMTSTDFLKENGVEKIINYNRKSRQDEELERKTGEDTLKNMRDLMDRVLEPMGIPYDQEDEIGSGDKIESRPIFQYVLKALEDKTYQAIAVKEISRMGRGSYTDMGIIYDLIVANRIFIITPSRVYDPKNGTDLRQIRFELFFAREEFETTRERLAGGRFTRAMEGRWMSGKAPFGYKLNKDSRKLEIDEDTARIVRIIFDLFAYGIPVEGLSKKRDVRHRALASYLMEQKIPTPTGRSNRWRAENLKYMLSNEVYLGTVSYRRTESTSDGKVIDRPDEEHVVVYNAHDPIIDLKTWNIVQEKQANTSYNPRVRLHARIYELTGLCVCKSCGNKLVRNEQQQNYRKKNDEVSVYRKEFLVCNHTQCTKVKYELVLEQLIETISYLRGLNDEEIETTLSAITADKTEVVPQKSIKDIEQYIDRRSAELNSRMKFIRDKYELGKY
ncbi:recombinase family protein, partial [Paenibacillus sp. MCAF20]